MSSFKGHPEFSDELANAWQETTFFRSDREVSEIKVLSKRTIAEIDAVVLKVRQELTPEHLAIYHRKLNEFVSDYVQNLLDHPSAARAAEQLEALAAHSRKILKEWSKFQDRWDEIPERGRRKFRKLVKAHIPICDLDFDVGSFAERIMDDFDDCEFIASRLAAKFRQQTKRSNPAKRVFAEFMAIWWGRLTDTIPSSTKAPYNPKPFQKIIRLIENDVKVKIGETPGEKYEPIGERMLIEIDHDFALGKPRT